MEKGNIETIFAAFFEGTRKIGRDLYTAVNINN